MENDKSNKKQILVDFNGLWQALIKHKFLFIKVQVVTFVLGCLYTLSLPNYYSAGVTLAPEMAGKRSGSGLSSLASSFGVSIGGMTSGEDALSPSLYPDMMSSVDFKTSLFPIKVREYMSKDYYTYYEYLKDHQKVPWWSSIKNSIKSLFASEETDKSQVKVDPFILTKDQFDIIRLMSSKIGCDVDLKTNVISISVVDQDPLVAATMADSVKQRLQDAITAYRTSKARVDLEYNKKLYDETKAKYDEARQLYASFADANQDVVLQRDRNRLIELENEMQLRYQAYSTVAAQLQAAEAKVQEETPAFTTIQNATVPLLKAGPRRSRMVILYCFFAFIITVVYVLYKEKLLKRLVFGLDGEEYDTKSL